MAEKNGGAGGGHFGAVKGLHDNGGGRGGISVMVTGPIMIDVIGSGVPRFADYAGDDNLFGNRFNIAAGGKARNIALMIAQLVGPGRVALGGRVCQDPFQLWQMIVQPLKSAGVHTDSLSFVPYVPGETEPAVVMIVVDETGHSKYFAFNRLNEQFSSVDVDHAMPVLEEISTNAGYVVLSLGQPLATILYTLQKAEAMGIKVILDPGGYNFRYDHSEVLEHRFHLIKPNIQEAEFFAGMSIAGIDDARLAARKLRDTFADNVLLSLGVDGALLVNSEAEILIPAPAKQVMPAVDATGCGDQLLAAVCASLIDGRSIEEAARLGVMAGTIQSQRAGVIPLTRDEFVALC